MSSKYPRGIITLAREDERELARGRERWRHTESAPEGKRKRENERVRNNAHKELAAYSEMGCVDRRCRCCEALESSYV
jgi:hypothetical protein